MQIVPVIDLLGGQVVRGVGGRRHEYRPIQSLLCPEPEPLLVARAFQALGFSTVYLADLDAIQTGNANLPCYEQLLRLGLDLWIDAGLTSAAQAAALARFEVDGRAITGVVAGLESLDHPRTLADICNEVGPGRLIFSLDLKHGTPLVGSAAWHGLTAAQIAALALRAGVRRMIVLDLAQVGMGSGTGTVPLCRTLRSLAAELQIVAGGGVRGPADLDALARADCDAALVASALHDGRLAPQDWDARPRF